MMTYCVNEDPESRPVIIALLALLAVVAVGCGSNSDTAPPFEVEASVVSHQMTQDISVWVPEGGVSWPIVYAIHGNGADRSRWDVTAPALAGQGIVVFAPDDRSTEPWNYESDNECSWRYVASIAAEYGGDLD